jgi:hypothetical protein
LLDKFLYPLVEAVPTKSEPVKNAFYKPSAFYPYSDLYKFSIFRVITVHLSFHTKRDAKELGRLSEKLVEGAM